MGREAAKFLQAQTYPLDMGSAELCAWLGELADSEAMRSTLAGAGDKI